MNTILNYLIEANLGLVFFYAIYWLVLQNENQFTFKRTFLLTSLVASLLFPLFTIQTTASLIPTLSNTAALQWLPEFVVYANGTAPVDTTQTQYWNWVSIVYIVIAVVAFIFFAIRIISIVRLFTNSQHYTWKDYTIVESRNVTGVFSFFKYIFLSPKEELSAEEKNEILRHEEVHIQKLHSIDIVLIQLLGIVFWFNPIIRSYKKSLVQVHEFEADARSVAGHDVDLYCSLLAKVALQNNGYVLANHFTNSLTLKRIAMMKTVRTKIKNWKVLAAALTLPLFFFVVACQDQIDNLKVVAENSSMSLDYPKEVSLELARLKSNNPPNTKFEVLEMNEDGKKRMEIIANENHSNFIEGYPVTVKENSEERNFLIYKKDGQTKMINELTVSENDIFNIVDESASPNGGMPVFYKLISEQIKYPAEARAKGTQGRVFVEFIVNTDGSIYDPHVVRGIGDGCDEEAVRMVSLSPSWIPGKQKGKIVKQRMVLPIIFKLEGPGNNGNRNLGHNKESTMPELVVSAEKKN